jgi:hypothetical protein
VGFSDQDAARLPLIHGFVKLTTRATRFIITQHGYMGLVPAIAKQGDLCSIIFGCTAPSPMWPVPAANESTYKILGPAYVLGSDYVRLENLTPHILDEESLDRYVPSGLPTAATLSSLVIRMETLIPASFGESSITLGTMMTTPGSTGPRSKISTLCKANAICRQFMIYSNVRRGCLTVRRRTSTR